jgi:hypothetical protein
MAWNLHDADLPDDAKAYLSVLGSHGDEEQARRECGVSEAKVRTWARLDEFIDHRQRAFAHFEDWKDWRANRERVDPAQWPSQGRLDTRYDPWRVG